METLIERKVNRLADTKICGIGHADKDHPLKMLPSLVLEPILSDLLEHNPRDFLNLLLAAPEIAHRVKNSYFLPRMVSLLYQVNMTAYIQLLEVYPEIALRLLESFTLEQIVNAIADDDFVQLLHVCPEIGFNLIGCQDDPRELAEIKLHIALHVYSVTDAGIEVTEEYMGYPSQLGKYVQNPDTGKINPLIPPPAVCQEPDCVLEYFRSLRDYIDFGLDKCFFSNESDFFVHLPDELADLVCVWQDGYEYWKYATDLPCCDQSNHHCWYYDDFEDYFYTCNLDLEYHHDSDGFSDCSCESLHYDSEDISDAIDRWEERYFIWNGYRS